MFWVGLGFWGLGFSLRVLSGFRVEGFKQGELNGKIKWQPSTSRAMQLQG